MPRDPDADALLARLRNNPRPQALGRLEAQPNDVDVTLRWAAELGLGPGVYASPGGAALGLEVERWAAARGWVCRPSSWAIGAALRHLGCRRVHRATGWGWGIAPASEAARLLAAAGLTRPPRRKSPRGPRAPPRKQLLPLVAEALRPTARAWLDSTGAVWRSSNEAARWLRVEASLLRRTARGEGRTAAGRCWWRLPPASGWLHLVRPGARLGEPKALCWCAVTGDGHRHEVP